MKQIKIALDMDEVIVDLIGNWKRHYIIEAGLPNDIEIAVSDWDVALSFDKLSKNKIYAMLDKPGIFSECDAVTDSIHYIKKLLADKRFIVDVITVAKAKTAYHEKLDWIKRNLGEDLMHRTIALSSHTFKAELAQNYDVLVEDNWLTLSKVTCGGCSRILFGQPHNWMAEYPKDYDHKVFGWSDLHEKLVEIWENA